MNEPKEKNIEKKNRKKDTAKETEKPGQTKLPHYPPPLRSVMPKRENAKRR
jgi:hypothetical protein